MGLFPLGLGGVLLGTADIIAGYRSLTWPAVPGYVMSSTLVPRLLAPLQPEVRYGYAVGRERYVSTRIWPGNTFAHMPESPRASQRLIDRFVQGRSVVVRVNPSDPLDVALVPGPRKACVWMAIFTFFLSLGFWSPWAVGLLFEKTLMRRRALSKQS